MGHSGTLSAITRTPERTYSEPAEYGCETSSDGKVTGGPLASMKRVEFANQSHQAYSGKGKENKASYFEPQLVQDASEMAQRGPNAARNRAIGLAALHLLARNPGGNAHFSRG
jgi:hypothetical protein